MTVLGWLLGKLTSAKPVKARAVAAHEAFRRDGKPGGPVTDPADEDTQPFGRPACRHNVRIGGKCANPKCPEFER